MPTFVYILAYWLIRFVVSAVRSFVQASVVRKGGPQVITLNLQFARTVTRNTLCTRCVFSHIVDGYEPQERIVFCGFAFPLREVPFAVKECTDLRSARPVGMEVLKLEET